MMNRTNITIEIEDDLVEALHRFVADMDVGITLPEAIQAALRDWAISHGYLPANAMEEDSRTDGSA